MSFSVIHAGYYSSIQDYGRFGMAHIGMSRCGAIDEHAYCWANHLLANNINDATLEISYGGCEILATSDCIIAVTGADFGFKINDKPHANWQVFRVKQGDKLTWSYSKEGVRTYLAVKGGFQTETLFNSRSANIREHIGVLIQSGDLLLTQSQQPAVVAKSMAPCFQPKYEGILTLRLLPSYQYEKFNQHQCQQLLTHTYEIKSYDRTGCQLSGQPMQDLPAVMTSEGMSYGSVEITTAGLPIILLKDSPTIGGYPKIGTVFSLDLAQLAQRHVGTQVRFTLIDIDNAQQLRRQFNDFFGIVF